MAGEKREPKRKGMDDELLSHLINHPDEELERKKQDDNVFGFAFANTYNKAKNIEIGGVNVAEWYTKEIDASGAGIRPWDRRADEPIEAYQAFVLWLFSGVDKEKKRTRLTTHHNVAGRRIYSKAYQNYLRITGQSTGEELDKIDHIPPSWKEYRERYEWEKRAGAYDRQDLEEFGEQMALARRDIEEKVGQALLKGMQVCMDKLENADLSELSLSAAIYAMVQISQELRNFITFQERGKPAASTVLEMLPDSLRQAVLVAINVDQIVVQKQKEEEVVDVK